MNKKPSLYQLNKEKWSGKKVLLTTLAMIVLGVLIQLVSSLILTWVLSFFPNLQQSYGELESHLSEKTMMNILYIVVLAPLFEELIFRYAALGLAYRFLPFWVANLIQAVLFALYHFDPVQSVYAFFLAILIGYVLYKTRYMGFVIILHMSVNLSGLLLSDVL